MGEIVCFILGAGFFFQELGCVFVGEKKNMSLSERLQNHQYKPWAPHGAKTKLDILQEIDRQLLQGRVFKVLEKYGYSVVVRQNKQLDHAALTQVLDDRIIEIQWNPNVRKSGNVGGFVCLTKAACLRYVLEHEFTHVLLIAVAMEENMSIEEFRKLCTGHNKTYRNLNFVLFRHSAVENNLLR